MVSGPSDGKEAVQLVIEHHGVALVCAFPPTGEVVVASGGCRSVSTDGLCGLPPATACAGPIAFHMQLATRRKGCAPPCVSVEQHGEDVLMGVVRTERAPCSSNGLLLISLIHFTNLSDTMASHEEGTRGANTPARVAAVASHTERMVVGYR